MNKYYTKLLLISLSFLLISRSAIASSCQQSELATKESLLFSKNLEYQTKSENDPNKINRKLIKPQLSQAVIWWAVKQFDYNSELEVNRLVYSSNLNDADADLKVISRHTDIMGNDAVDALSDFSADNFEF